MIEKIREKLIHWLGGVSRSELLRWCCGNHQSLDFSPYYDKEILKLCDTVLYSSSLSLKKKNMKRKKKGTTVTWRKL